MKGGKKKTRKKQKVTTLKGDKMSSVNFNYGKLSRGIWKVLVHFYAY